MSIRCSQFLHDTAAFFPQHRGVKITRILAYRVELPLHETTYKWSGGKSVTVFDRDRKSTRLNSSHG